MAAPKLGLQLIVYGGRPQEDLAGVLQEVAEAGYVGIEAGNLFATHGPQQVKDLLAQTGLEVCGSHGGYADCEDPAKVEANIAYLKAVGSRYLICSGVAPGEGIAAYEQAAETFNRVGAQCQQSALSFCYHNHAWEFEALRLRSGQAFDGVKGIHRLCEVTDPALVKLCVDVYWVTIGKENPAEFIERYADRAVYFHFKDGGDGYFVELGQGSVDLPGAAQAALKTVREWIVCEQDHTDLEPAESIAQSYACLKQLGL